jgi:MoaA/NifB/PqqE/SkfB family radical SAM enzyme
MSNNTFCAALWHSMFYKETPSVITRPCCVYQEVITTSLDPADYLSSPKLAKAREQSLAGQWPDACIRCKTKEGMGLHSDRQHENKKHGIKSAEDLINVVPTIKSIEYRPGNMCNLKCRMCTPSESFLIQKEIQQYPELLKDMYAHDYYDDAAHEFYKTHDPRNVELNQHIINHDIIKNIFELKIIGGEPSIDENIHSAINWIIDNDYAKNIRLKYTTNLTNVNESWLKLHDSFKHNRITFSMDATGRTYEYIRTPAKWKTIKNNLHTLKQRLPDAMTSINVVYSLFNCFTVDEWYEELLTECLHNDDMININHASQRYLQPGILPQFIKDQLIDQLNDVPDSVLKESMIGFLKLPGYSNNIQLLKQFVKFSQSLDQIRNTDINELSPLYKQLVEYVENNRG